MFTFDIKRIHILNLPTYCKYQHIQHRFLAYLPMASHYKTVLLHFMTKMLSKRSFKIRSSLFFKWAIHYFRLLNTVDSKYIKIADDLSLTVDLWCWKRPLNQLCQNNSPRFTLFLFYFWQNYERKCYRAYFSISQSVSVKTDWNLNFRMNRRAPSQSGNRQQRLKTHKNVFLCRSRRRWRRRRRSSLNENSSKMQIFGFELGVLL